MPISARMLTKWRSETLLEIRLAETAATTSGKPIPLLVHQRRILVMTQELLDQHLIRNLDMKSEHKILNLFVKENPDAKDE